jgi:hypothetical protein
MSNTIEMPKPRTDAQRAAARANGAKSKGPITPEGKSALNALRHGMLAGSLVLTSESRAKFDAVLHDYLDEYQPEGRTENDLIEAIVAANWLQQRCWTITTSLMNVTMDRMAEAIDGEFSDIDTGTRTALAFLKQADQSTAIALLNRYAARHDREWHRALANLRTIQKERRERSDPPSQPQLNSPNEPEPDLTPEPSTTSNSQPATAEPQSTGHRPLATDHCEAAEPSTTSDSPLDPASDSTLATRHSPLDLGTGHWPLATDHCEPGHWPLATEELPRVSFPQEVYK